MILRSGPTCGLCFYLAAQISPLFKGGCCAVYSTFEIGMGYISGQRLIQFSFSNDRVQRCGC